MGACALVLGCHGAGDETSVPQGATFSDVTHDDLAPVRASLECATKPSFFCAALDDFERGSPAALVDPPGILLGAAIEVGQGEGDATRAHEEGAYAFALGKDDARLGLVRRGFADVDEARAVYEAVTTHEPISREIKARFLTDPETIERYATSRLGQSRVWTFADAGYLAQGFARDCGKSIVVVLWKRYSITVGVFPR